MVLMARSVIVLTFVDGAGEEFLLAVDDAASIPSVYKCSDLDHFNRSTSERRLLLAVIRRKIHV